MKLILLLISVFFILRISAQGFVSNGAEITVTKGAVLSVCGIEGHFVNLNDGVYDARIDLAGEIELHGSWVNNTSSGVFTGQADDGIIVFSGNAPQLISGTSRTEFENVVINKSSYLLADASEVAIYGDISINFGTFNANGRNIYVYGDWLNFDSFIPANSLVVFKGANPQIIISGANTFDSVQFDNLNSGNMDIAIIDDLTVSKFAGFINGIVYPHTAGRLIFTDGALCNGGTEESFFTGNVLKEGADSFVFPVGKISSGSKIWAPLSISDRTAADVFVCEYFDAPAPYNADPSFLQNGLVSTSDTEYWTLDRIAGSASPFVTLYSKDNIRSGTVAGNQTVVADFDYISLKWESLGGNYIENGQEGYIIADITYSGKPIVTFGFKKLNSPLPVSLLYFDVFCDDSRMLFKWATASESNNERFVVEVSADLNEWHEVLCLPGVANSSNINHYSAYGHDAETPVFFCRLVQYDFDGNCTKFEPIIIKCKPTEILPEIRVYPNPSNGKIFIEFKDCSNFLVNIYDMKGKCCYSNAHDIKESDTFSVDIPDLSAGYYILQVNCDSKVKQFKILFSKD